MAQYRDPSKCWKCKGSSHISSSCNSSKGSAPHHATQQESRHRRKNQNPLSPAATLPPKPIGQTSPVDMQRVLERRLSIGSASVASQRLDLQEARGSAINYPGNPRFHPRLAFKFAATTDDMEDRKEMMRNHAVVVTEEGPLGLQSKEELKDIIRLHFGIRKHEFYAYRSYPDPFVLIFPEAHDRDVVFAAGRLVDGPIELRFHLWDLDRFGDCCMIPFHVKLSIEGLPQHAWFQEIADKVLCDEAIIHHVEEETRKRLDHRAYRCWAFSKDPSSIPQTVYLTLAKHEPDPKRNVQIHFNRPRSMKAGFVFRVFIHIDAIEDLMFYHYPREELIADGRVPWRDFHWQYGRPDGDLDDADDRQPPQPRCRPDFEYRRHTRDDDEGDRDQKRQRSRGFISRMSGWIDGRGKNKERQPENDHGSGWYKGESSRGRQKTIPNLSACFMTPRGDSKKQTSRPPKTHFVQEGRMSDAIVINPIDLDPVHKKPCHAPTPTLDAQIDVASADVWSSEITQSQADAIYGQCNTSSAVINQTDNTRSAVINHANNISQTMHDNMETPIHSLKEAHEGENLTDQPVPYIMQEDATGITVDQVEEMDGPYPISLSTLMRPPRRKGGSSWKCCEHSKKPPQNQSL